MINDRLVDAGDLPIAVRDFGGDQPPLLLLHDTGGNLAQLTSLGRALRPHRRVITMDLRGHGRSGDGPWSWDAALGDLAAVVVQLELDRPAVAGHGLGGMLATLWGQRHPEAPGVISLDGIGLPGRHLAGLDADRAEAELRELLREVAAAEAGHGRVIEPDQLPDVVETERMTARDMGANEKVWLEGFRRNLVHAGGLTSIRPSAEFGAAVRTAMGDFDLMSVLAATRCPELIVLPTRLLPWQEPFADLYESHRRQVAEQLSAVPHVRYLQLADASSALVIEQPETLARAISDFLHDTV